MICVHIAQTAPFSYMNGDNPFILSFLYLSLFLIGVGAAIAASAHPKISAAHCNHPSIKKRKWLCRRIDLSVLLGTIKNI